MSDPAARIRPPPAGFDPIKAGPQELAEHHLPPKPDPARQPALYSAWHRLFLPPLNWTDALIEPIKELQIQPFRRVSAGASRIQPSPNWCGAQIVPHGGRQFVQIYGEWTVPTPSLPPPYDQGPAGQKNPYQSSAWIGLDGDRLYLNSSLPQVGTEQDLITDASGVETRDYFAWFQWWHRKQVGVTYERINGITIQPGMEVMGTIWAISPKEVVVLFRNFAPLNQITLFVRSSPEVYASRTKIVNPTISGATAQWIMERPTVLQLNSTILDLFPSYTPAGFHHCVAGTAVAAGPASGEQTVVSPRLKRMFEVARDAPARTRLISMPHWVSDTSVEAT